MKLTMIAAMGKNREIGKDNQLIWHFPSDLKFFRQTTKGHTIVMGRKTFESLPGMLPNRHHIVISRTNPELPEDVECFGSIEKFLEAYKDKDEEVFVIGGAQIYAQMEKYCDAMVLTEIDQSYEADAFYPDFDRNAYNRTVIKNVHENGAYFEHVLYEKK